MKNEMSLDGYSVQVLSYEDKKNTDGGILPFILIGGMLLLSGCTTGCSKKIIPWKS